MTTNTHNILTTNYIINKHENFLLTTYQYARISREFYEKDRENFDRMAQLLNLGLVSKEEYIQSAAEMMSSAELYGDYAGIAVTHAGWLEIAQYVNTYGHYNFYNSIMQFVANILEENGFNFESEMATSLQNSTKQGVKNSQTRNSHSNTSQMLANTSQTQANTSQMQGNVSTAQVNTTASQAQVNTSPTQANSASQTQANILQPHMLRQGEKKSTTDLENASSDNNNGQGLGLGLSSTQNATLHFSYSSSNVPKSNTTKQKNCPSSAKKNQKLKTKTKSIVISDAKPNHPADSKTKADASLQQSEKEALLARKKTILERYVQLSEKDKNRLLFETILRHSSKETKGKISESSILDFADYFGLIKKETAKGYLITVYGNHGASYDRPHKKDGNLDPGFISNLAKAFNDGIEITIDSLKELTAKPRVSCQKDPFGMILYALLERHEISSDNSTAPKPKVN